MPRKSTASLSIVPMMIDNRPSPPNDLTEEQQDIWKRIVGSEPAEFFKTAATQILLGEFCKHVDAARVLGRAVNGFRDEWWASQEGVDRYNQLLQMRDRETKALTDKATKLRLTNQSRWQPAAAASRAKNESAQAKPWEKAG